MLENLKILRTEFSITQKQLADVIGVSQQSINKYENHNIEPDIETLKRIADYFETSIDFLVGYSSERRKAGISSPQDISRQENSLIRKYRTLTQKEKQSIDLVIENYLNK